jgi:DNA-binding transcriptional LysR family regulator
MPLTQPYPDLAALDLLVSVSELGSISAAARVHHVTQPAASMRLKALEDALQIRLLDRSQVGASLTSAGVATVEWAGAVLREVRTLQTGAAALRSDHDSHLQLAASLTAAEYLLPHWLEQFGRVRPQVKVSLEMGNTAHVLELVTRGHVELGFIEGPQPPERLQSSDVAEDELVLVVGHDHPWTRRRAPVAPHELAETPLVLRETGSGTRNVLTEALARYALNPSIAIELGSTTAIKTAVISGTGPAVVSGLAVHNELRSGQLVAVPFSDLTLKRIIRAVWRDATPLPSAARDLLQIASSRAARPATEP